MELLDKIIEMQKQGLGDSQINLQLQNEGISPKQINDALNQAKVKSAVSPQETAPEQPSFQSAEPPQTSGEPEQLPPLKSPPQSPGQFPPEESPGQIPLQENPQQQMQPPTPSEAGQQYPAETQDQYSQNQDTEAYAPSDQDYYTQTPQGYSGQESYYDPSGGFSTETVSEIAEQVVSEKTEELSKK